MRQETVDMSILIKAVIKEFSDYQEEWLISHCDIEFNRREEDLILIFLKNTADSFISEYTE